MGSSKTLKFRKNFRFENFVDAIRSGIKVSPCDLIELVAEEDYFSQTPLHHAIMAKRLDLVEQLLTICPETVNTQSKGYRSPLNFAVSGNTIEIVKLLLKYNADTNCCDLIKRTPLHFAAENGLIDIAKLLLDFGADPNLCDSYKMLPIDLVQDDDDAMINLLKKYMY